MSDYCSRKKRKPLALTGRRSVPQRKRSYSLLKAYQSVVICQYFIHKSKKMQSRAKNGGGNKYLLCT